MSSKGKNTDSEEKQVNVDIGFSDMALSSTIQKSITESGYETPTPIQAQAIPSLLEGRDILGAV